VAFDQFVAELVEEVRQRQLPAVAKEND